MYLTIIHSNALW